MATVETTIATVMMVSSVPSYLVRSDRRQVTALASGVSCSDSAGGSAPTTEWTTDGVV